jgi:GTPase SAR1 family protein
MIFDVSSSQIESLDSKQLVELLKKLLFAEAQYSGISLHGVSVPLQITVPDGGEDARISWVGGLEQTDYLPSRFCIFQSKATDPNRAGWKKEVWTKKSQKSGSIPKLNNAVKKAIAENGAYIGFTRTVLIGSKYDERIEGIKEGLREAGADPERLRAIEIYDANKIAAWVSRYPAIAVWLHEKQSDLTLRSFQTIDRLGRRSDIQTVPQVEDKSSRFLIGGKDNSSQAASDENSLTFAKVRERILDYLADPGAFIRILGPSGVGKTRFVYEILRDKTTTTRMTLATSAIYCDFRDVGRQIFQITQSLSEAGNSALMIVDECPRETAIKLCEIATTEGSNLRILTIGNDSQSIEKDNCLNISVAPADEGLIDSIIQQRYPKADHSDIQFIRELSGGYPRIAVLATDNYSEGAPILKSVEDVVERILAGCGINRVEQIRAVECLALFNQLGADENVSNELDFVAEKLARQTGDEMYEHLVMQQNSILSINVVAILQYNLYPSQRFWVQDD